MIKGRRLGKVTFIDKIVAKIDAMEIGESISKLDFIEELYDDCDYFIIRSFDVHFSNAKKKLHLKVFRVIKKQLTRIS